MGISGNLGMWISTFLMGRTQSVKIDGIVSEKIEILSGVPQGSVLGPILFLIYIADIGSKSKSKAYIYVDDSKVLSSIRGEEDVEFFQNDLENYYYWAKSNNMSFNDTKFVVLRYGKDASIKENTSYFTDGMGWIIEEKETHKDLGILMSSSGKFSDHINEVTKKVKKKISWICRTFVSRDLEVMRRLYVTQVRPLIDYCAQVWAPCEGPELDRVERLLYNYTKLSPSIRHLPYSERLKAMSLMSVQRRFDRYRVIYVRKCLLGLVPSCGIRIIHNEDHRNGLMVKSMDKRKMLNLRSQSFISRGPDLFNSLPKDLRTLMGSMDTFKKNLDSFLKLIEDVTRIEESRSYTNNSLDKRINEWTWRLNLGLSDYS